jgi:regulation of enolase protein 1 (concanavalin A-like superfamily)
MEWYNQPTNWKVQPDKIYINSTAKTDFWRETHYGFIRDNGHFFYESVTGDFIVEAKISGEYQDLYDQAGIMVRLDEANWLKCGIEYVNGVQQVSAVVTRTYSDWSVVPMPENPPSLWVRVTRRSTAVEVHYSLDGQQYTMLRLAYLTPVEILKVGVMCASPEGNGFPMTFEGFKIQNLSEFSPN